MMRIPVRTVLLFCLLSLAGCQVQPVNEPVAIDVPANWDQPANTNAWPEPDWWRTSRLDR